MSSNLTLCVRDRSSPVGQQFNTTRLISYSEYNTLLTNYSTPVAKFLTDSFVMDESLSIPNPEQQKKRRFHPLRNLRRIFRRRTINTTSETSLNALEPQISVSERNLRSATLSAISKTASSQSQQFAQQELHDTFSSQSLPKFKSCGKSEQEIGNAPFNKVHLHEHQQQDLKEDSFVQSDMCATAQNLRTSLFHNTQLKQSLGDPVFPNSKNCDFSKEHKLLSANDCSSSNLCLSDYDSINKLISEHKTATFNTRKVPPRTSLQEMSNSQRSLIDERLFENGNNCEGLSQSHDSVFSHSATASNLSIVLKAELTDVLRKRRNRSEVSDEDIMFSQIPSLPNRPVQSNENEVNSDINRQNDENFTTVGKNICAEESNCSSVSCSRSLVSSSEQIPLNLSLEGRDDTDFFSSHRQMLSHDAAKHKMAIRPIKRKAPSHLKRKNVDIAAKKTNDKEISKFAYNDITNTHARNLTFNSYPSRKFAIETNREQYNTKTSTSSDLKQTTIKTTGVPEKINRTIILNSNINNELGSKDATVERNNAPYIETRESGFLRRLINRNSKRSITKSPVDQLPIDQSEPKKMQLNTPCYDTKLSFTNSESKKPTSVNTNFQDNIGMAKTEKLNTTKMEIEPMKNSNPVQEGNDKLSDKPKSGPAARQRCMPKNISEKINDKNAYNEIFQSTSLIKEISSTQIQNSSSLSTLKSDLNHNKILKMHESMPISGKITRSFECIGPALSSNSMETSTDDPLDYYEEKQRRVVEKSRSIKNQQEALASSTINNNLPSLPDLPISIRVPSAYLDEYILTGKRNSPPSPHAEQSKRASLGFEINDNNLLNIKTNVNASPTQTRKQRNGVALSRESEVTTNHMNSVNDIPTLPEIEQNIDMIVKSSFPQYPGKRFEQPLFQQQTALKKHIKNDDFAAHIQNSEKKRPRELYFLEKVNERTPDTTTVPLREKTMSLNLPTEKDVKFLDRKSVPVNQQRDQVADQSRSANRSLPIVSSNAVKINASLPEFLKIHLNPIEQDRTKKAGNLVLAKNVRQQIQTPSVNKLDCTSSVDHASSQLSNSFLSINECPPRVIQQSAIPHSSNLVVRSRQNETISPGIVNQTTIFDTSKKPVSKLLEDPASPNKEFFIDTSVKLSIQERKRIFLSEDNSKTPIRKSEHTNNNNGNKSNLVELNLKSSSKPDEIPSVLPPDSSSIEPSLVVLRKKSFRSNLPSGSNADTSLNETDGTPELMKVFARRSLKIKDDEIKTANDKENIVNLGTSNLNRKFNAVGSTKGPCTQVYVDSDKENQSTSVEKLDKITKNEKPTLGSANKNLNDNGSWTNSNVSNRNSVADFRQSLGKFTGNSNNYHNSNTTLHPTKLSHLPLKKGGYLSGNTEQAAPTNINTTNKPKTCIENKNNDIEKKPITIYKRENSENACEPGSNALSNKTKTIERSATVGEFKGIHQRRAEWEQRVKEAFK